MSISGMLSGHTVTVQADTITQDAARSNVHNWATSATLDCYVEVMSAGQVEEFAQKRGYRVTHMIYCSSDPGVGAGKFRFLFNGDTLEFRAVHKEDCAQNSDLSHWVIEAEKVTTRPT